MFVTLLVLCLANHIVAFGGEALIEYDLESAGEYFSWFVKTFNKTYVHHTEEKKRFEIFKSRLNNINKTNKEHGFAVYGINKFSDLTNAEALNMYTGCKLDEKYDTVCEIHKLANGTSGNTPDEYDWRTKNIVTDVKNQKDCGSCWAFSATGNIESQYAIKKEKLVVLSEQQLVDCDKDSDGCNGGLPDKGMKYLMNAGGQLSESDYPYKAVNQQCNADTSKAVAKLSNCISYETKDEEKLKEILYEVGPLSIAIDATDVFNYNGGVLKNCGFTELDHAVLLVGYGTDAEGTPYWLIKNSWGAGYGEKGYFKVQRGVNSCGLMNYFAITAVIAD